MATSETTFLASYRCPRCGARLEARTGIISPWLRCPQCQRASQPPDPAMRPRITPVISHGVDVLYMGPETPASTPTPAPPSTTQLSPAQNANTGFPESSGAFDEPEPVSIRRVILTTSLFVAVMMLLFTYLAQNGLGMSISAACSLIFLLLLLMPTRS